MIKDVTLTHEQMCEALALWVARTFAEGHRQKINNVQSYGAGDSATFEIYFKHELADPIPSVSTGPYVQVPRIIHRENQNGQPAQTD